MMQLNYDWVSPPGQTLSRSLSYHGHSRESAADFLQLSIEEFERLLIGSVSIDAELAERLEEITGKSRSFWLKREEQYRSELFQLSEKTTCAGDQVSSWEKMLPVTQMIRYGWIAKHNSRKDRFDSLLHFFGVASVKEWNERYSSELSVAAFRASNVYEADVAATATWLRKAEIIASNIHCSRWDKNKFRENLSIIRKFSLQKSPKTFWRKIQEICRECGVALVFVPSLKGCRAYGATRFLTPSKAMIVLSNRYKTDDHFWFTFFHESAHLVLHSSDALFVEAVDMDRSHEEEEANIFAENFLIPKNEIEEFSGSRVTWKKITRFALRIGTSPGVVLGQLQHKGMVSRSSHNFLKRRFADQDFEFDANL